ncbi:MAG: CotH kinase family protein [Ignavibacteriae bacterium]|nr:CotH kinase family protein [Ignavibacteriota bacterium]
MCTHGFTRTSILLLFLIGLSGLARSQSDSLLNSDLPIVIIDTFGQEIPDDPKITAFMGVIDNGPGMRNSLADSANRYRGYIGIEVRGYSSQQFPKLQYGIELRDSTGADVAVGLLGMSSDADWVLSAAYNDKTQMRNALAYALARRSGRYASQGRFCELVLNGQYWGTYVLFERLKRDKNRINVTKMATTDVAGDNVTGGYVVQVDRPTLDTTEFWASPVLPPADPTRPIIYQHVYPKPADLVPQQRAYIRSYITAFEAVMADSAWADPVNGYRKYLDLPSAVDFFLVNELARNVDAYRLSSYLHKDRDSKGGKLRVGPVWDFDLGFGNVIWSEGADTVGWDLLTMPLALVGSQYEDHVPPWWVRLGEDSSFWQSAGDRWAALRKGAFSTPNVLAFIDSAAAVLNEAQARNFVRWPILDSVVWGNPYVGGSYANEVTYLKEWTTARMAWMDNALPPARVIVPPPDSMIVRLDSLAARITDSVLVVTWLTTQERHTARFEVQWKNADSLAADTVWRLVDSVRAADSSAVIRQYTVRDTVQGPARWLLRVRTIGTLDTMSLSGIVPVSIPDSRRSLAVTIASFTVGAVDSVVSLAWTTSREQNTVQFRVQRRPVEGDTSWQVIQTLAGADTSSTTRSYAVKDTVPGGGDLLYRLVVAGWFGQQFTSTTRSVHVNGPDDTLHVVYRSINGGFTANGVDLVWKATGQSHVLGYAIERKRTLPESPDSVWRALDTVAATGVKADTVTYTFRDSVGPGGRMAYRVRALGTRGQFELSPELLIVLSAIGTEESVIPTAFDLSQNYPNPFNPSTTIRFDLPVESPVVITVYSTIGQRIAVLVDDRLPAGRHELRFDASSLPSGVYFYSMRAGEFVRHRKLMLVK